MLRYEIWAERPTLEFYRRGYCPREDYTLAGMWPGGIFTGASGKRYHGMRGFDEMAPDNAHTYIFVELNERNLYDNSPQLYPELYTTPIDVPAVEGLYYVGNWARAGFVLTSRCAGSALKCAESIVGRNLP
jgi:hypothetical protein